MSLLDSLTTMPTRERAPREKKDVAPWVKIKATDNPLKPKVKLSQSSKELIQSKNNYVLFRDMNSVLYIVTPSPFSVDTDPKKSTDTRITATNSLEITKAVTGTWGTDLSQYIGEYLLELVGEEELGTLSGNFIVKTFKLVPNGAAESTNEQNQETQNGLSHNESEVNGSESGVSESIDFIGGSDGSDLVLSEDSVL